MQKEHPLKIIKERKPLPQWLHRSLPNKSQYSITDDVINKNMLATVCEEAKCPNRFECYSKKTATFLLLGKICTRACGFCEIGFNKNPPPLDANEPINVAKSVKALSLKHVVLTQVARDDIEDGGAQHIKNIISAIRKENPGCTIEVLTSDFQGSKHALNTIFSAQPEIFNYNIETIERLTPKVRHKATYARTLSILSEAKKTLKKSFIKSGIMLGLGEQDDEIIKTLRDLKDNGVDIVTIGQYLQPSKRKLIPKDYITPEKFDYWKQKGEKLGIPFVYSGPYVRSSYNAEEIFLRLKK